MTNEADTCRKLVIPRLLTAGWDTEPHSFTEQRTFTDGRIVVTGDKIRRRPQKRADFILRYTRDFSLAVIEAKASYKTAGDGFQQAKEYAEILGLPFAYATNGDEILEFDYTTGVESLLAEFPSPADLWARYRSHSGIGEEAASNLLAPAHRQSGRTLRYYQEIAINRTIEAVLKGQRRILLTMATGTGKTEVAFQVCWKLWNTRWNRTGGHHRPKILFLADRHVLVDDPKDKTFAPFGEARFKIESSKVVKSREMYFALYQSLAEDGSRIGLFREYPRDFFDLIVVDECHRGSAREDSSWREILEYFEPAYQMGMTATPLRDETRDTYAYFGNPIYQYSLRQGIDDGFLAPYRVHRVITTFDAAGWRPSAGEIDRYGREIPDEEYQTKDFERVVALKARTEAIANHITDFLKSTDRFAKTIVFCVDQEHADEMRRALSNLNADLVQQNPDYVCRVTSAENDIGRGHLSRFQELETKTPTILTTSQMLTTGVDMPTCRVIALARVVNSLGEFKQIIGRGTRVREDYNKLFFTILDYTQSTRLFADPAFDGDPAISTEQKIDDEGKPIDPPVIVEPEENDDSDRVVVIGDDWPPDFGDEDDQPRKLYVDGGQIAIAAHLVYELAPDGTQLSVVQYSQYTADKVRTLYVSASELRAQWAVPGSRAEIVKMLGERGIDFDTLAEATNNPDADPFDLLCHVAFNAPLRTRRERAEMLRKDTQHDFFEQYAPKARAVLEALLEKYAAYGTTQFALPEVLKIPPVSDYGNVSEIAAFFGGPAQLRQAVTRMQELLYAP